MNRFRLEALKMWGAAANRKPLILRGARQVGKTWLVREYAKSFSSFCEINLESQTELFSFFEQSFGKPEELIQMLSMATGVRIVPGKTLLFLDEIQEVPKALLSLRYFKELLPKLHVIAAGSLIEFALKELSFPVGRVDFFYLFPLTFGEYLEAIGRQDWASQIAQASPTKPLSPALHDLTLKEVDRYSLIGGMPEVVKAYVDEKNLRRCQDLQQALAANFRSDFNKYAARAGVAHLRILFDAVPRWIGQKFKYSRISTEVRSRELSKALSLLEDAGLVYRATHSSGNGVPLNSESKLEKFKVFFIDIGLCQRVLGSNLAFSPKLPSHRGAIAEQFVAQELIALTPYNEAPKLFYWHREAKSAQAEVDFLVERNSGVIPIEVKSGTKGSQRSLTAFMNEKKSPLGAKISENGFSQRAGMRHKSKIWEIPFYGVPFMASPSPPKSQ